MNCKKENECNCRIHIEDSIAIIICGEVEIERMKHLLGNAAEEKGHKNPNIKVKPYSEQDSSGQ
ncbi:MAG: hypothetical protein ACOX0T_11200 [Pelotomaculum sp.]|jgi:hypothetical protein